MPRLAASPSPRSSRARKAQARTRARAPAAAPTGFGGLFPRLGGARAKGRAQNVRRKVAGPVTLRGGVEPVAGAPIGPIARRFASFIGRFAVAGALAWGLLIGARSAYAFVTTSPRFAATHLIYAPTAHLSAERIAGLMAIEEGTNILSLDLPELEAKIAGDRWVAAVKVQRELPDTLRVEVVEHEPAAILLADRFYLIDRQGRPFKRLDRGERGELPVITGVDRKALLAGIAGPKLERALAAMDAYAAGGRPRLGEIHIGATDELTLTTAESRTQLRLGREAIEDKLGRFDALRAALGDRADHLAVVHLDAIGRGDERERIIASFNEEGGAGEETRGSAAWSVDGVGRDTHADAPGEAPKKGAAAAAHSPNKGKSAGASKGKSAKKARRIPRYE